MTFFDLTIVERVPSVVMDCILGVLVVFLDQPFLFVALRHDKDLGSRRVSFILDWRFWFDLSGIGASDIITV